MKVTKNPSTSNREAPLVLFGFQVATKLQVATPPKKRLPSPKQDPQTSIPKTYTHFNHQNPAEPTKSSQPKKSLAAHLHVTLW